MNKKTVERESPKSLGVPDEDLFIRKPISDRLMKQRKAVALGQRGKAFVQAVRRLGLD